jgi:hypothetical protein
MTEPQLSVVIATRDGWAPIGRTIHFLAEQTVADRIEVVLASFGGGVVRDPPSAVERLAGYRVVDAQAARSLPEARAIGAAGATAPVVAFGEDHAFPLPDWAAALLARHEEPWAVVGPVVRNANPDRAASRADFALGYALFCEGQVGGEVGATTGHNSAYKREVLVRYADELEAGLGSEWSFHARLRSRGERIYLEPRAIVRHVNFSRARPFFAATFKSALAGAATRAEGWSAPRRAFYAAGSVVLPVLRLAHTMRILPDRQRGEVRGPALLMLFAALVCDAAGQAAGFVNTRPDDAQRSVSDLEVERVRFVTAAEAASLW